MARRSFADHARKSGPGHGLTVAVVLLALVAAFFGWRWWQVRQAGPAVDSVSLAPLEGADEVAPAAGPAAAPQTPADPVKTQPAETGPPRYPIESPEAAGNARATPSNADARIGAALTELLGKTGVATFLQIDDLVRRVVAGVDNLTRVEAPRARWPLQPVPGRFGAAGEGGARAIDPANDARYAPLVRFAESVDTERAVALYREHYPLFQQAYEDLGYPKRYFNDRLVDVIDHLLEAPEPAAPPLLTRLEIKGPYQDPRPWTRYEFADADLQALSAGQKMLVRMGLENQRRLKAKLRQLRAAVTAGAAAKR